MSGENGTASRLQLPQGPWSTVLEGLCARFPRVPRAQWLARMQRGRVQLEDGTPLRPDAPYRVGLELRYFRELAQEAVVPFQERIIHADEHLVVADKPHFLPVTPAGAYVEQSLLRRLVRRLGLADLVPLHRIDRGTAGLVMFSARPDSRARYQALFSERRIEKGYEALAAPIAGLDFPLVRATRLEPGEPFFRMRETPGAPNSETRIAVAAEEGEVWRYALVPVTGRKHQLRVHLAALGAPILNDPFYPELQPAAPDDPERPLKLLAKSLAFDDPITGEPRRFESSLEL